MVNILQNFRYGLIFDYNPLEDVSMYAVKVTPIVPLLKPLQTDAEHIAVKFLETEDFSVGNALMDCLGKNIGSLKIQFKKSDNTLAKTLCYNNVVLVDCMLNDLDSSSGGVSPIRNKLVATTSRSLTWFERILRYFGVKIETHSNFEGSYTVQGSESHSSFVEWVATFKFDNTGETK